MNNQQFRDLFRQNKGEDATLPANAERNALGTKRAAIVPTTPRPGYGGASSNVDFARQVRERNAGLQPPAKRFKSSTPMGSKLASGYTDRAKERAEATKQEEEEKNARIKALEAQVKSGNLSHADFESLREKILADDGSDAPRVRGLDRTLLERARRGEDNGGGSDDKASAVVDVDAELDRLGHEDVKAIARTQAEKHGSKAPSQNAGIKKSRDQIMAELKAKRQAAAEAKAAANPVFDHRWRKVGEQAKSRIEIDHKGREVLITVDEDGIVKRMVRKVPKGSDVAASHILDTTKPVLGADYVLPEQKPNPNGEADESDDDDIFVGAGADYNPLGDVADSDDSDEDQVPTSLDAEPKNDPGEGESERERENSEQPANPPGKRQNYFKETTEHQEMQQPSFDAVQNIIKKAAQLGSLQPDEIDEEEKARREKREKMLARDRDLDDMDLGFGSNRFDDAEDGEGGAKGRLSEWKQTGGGDRGWDDDDDDGEKGGAKRKRKPKKRKGDVNNADDIMRVLEGRRAAANK